LLFQNRFVQLLDLVKRLPGVRHAQSSLLIFLAHASLEFNRHILCDYAPYPRFLEELHLQCDLRLLFFYGWIGHKSGSGFINLAPSILHYNWF
jgi:hypothetical protein